MVEVGCYAAWAPNQAGLQRGSHPLHNAHCSGYQHTAGVRCPLPTAHCPPSPFCSLPLHAVPRLVPLPH